MPLLQVQVSNTKLTVDLEEELSPYFPTDSYKVRWTDEKLSAPSPFRYEKKPSFFVNLAHVNGKETGGTWMDSGTGETGRLEHLLCFLRNESIEETVFYLREKYGVKDYDRLTLNLDFKTKQEWKPLLFQGDEFALDYMESRGIPNKVTAWAGVMDLGDRIAFHWYNPNGVIVAIKYRYKDKKDFYYEKGGKRLNEQLYNIQRVYEVTTNAIWICEGETDALSIEGVRDGNVGIALGGASFSDSQRDKVIRSGIQNIVVATDNDKQGQVVAKQIEKKLNGLVQLWSIDLLDCKDINEFVVKYKSLPKPTRIKGQPLW